MDRKNIFLGNLLAPAFSIVGSHVLDMDLFFDFGGFSWNKKKNYS